MLTRFAREQVQIRRDGVTAWTQQMSEYLAEVIRAILMVRCPCLPRRLRPLTCSVLACSTTTRQAATT